MITYDVTATGPLGFQVSCYRPPPAWHQPHTISAPWPMLRHSLTRCAQSTPIGHTCDRATLLKLMTEGLIIMIAMIIMITLTA